MKHSSAVYQPHCMAVVRRDHATVPSARIRRKRLVRLPALVIALLAVTSVAGAAPTYDVAVDTQIRSTVLFVGDSNITKGAAQIAATLTTRSDGTHLPVFGSRSGTGIRGYGPNACPSQCDASDYWALKVANILASVTPAVVVVDLAINDFPTAGTPTGLGYSNYSAKIDWLMSHLPDVPVLWTNLPCGLEVAPYNGVGCSTINTELAAADTRIANLTVLPWQ